MSDSIRHSQRAKGQVRRAVNTKVTEALRDLLEVAAHANNRTLSAEIEARLAESFWPVAQPDTAALIEAAIECAFARRDAVPEPIGSPPPAYAQ